MRKYNILVADDEINIRKIFTRLLSDEGYIVEAVENGEKAIKKLETFRADIVLLDQNMPGINGIETLELIKKQYPETTVIIITAYGAVNFAVEAIKKGAYDYIEKPFDNKKLILTIKRALDHNQLTNEVLYLKQKLTEKYNFDSIIGISPKMQQVLEQVKCVCETDASVLILGESGVGKELIAKAIHFNSLRKEKPLISINCGAIPLQLIESELFGHEKGAFTDAKELKTGRFEQADEGTLFLDEIGELPLEAQVKLLRVLEDKKIYRVGGKKQIPVNVRIISATNKNLEEKVQQGLFRLDLFYRLNVFTILVPPLRERKNDIPLLTEHFIHKYNAQLKLDIPTISKLALNLLINYDWPGNIRDLENAIQSSMITAKHGIINEEHIPVRVYGFKELKNTGGAISKGINENIYEINSKLEKELIVNALQKCNYNRSETAKLLQISRKTLFNKMKKHQL